MGIWVRMEEDEEGLQARVTRFCCGAYIKDAFVFALCAPQAYRLALMLVPFFPLPRGVALPALRRRRRFVLLVSPFVSPSLLPPSTPDCPLPALN